MNVLAVNGSPRKTWNTATLLQKSLEGAMTQGAQTELIDLYDVEFRGCISCFACKTIDGPSYGRCIVKDGLTPILQKIEKTDALILGSPVYFGSATPNLMALLDRAGYVARMGDNPFYRKVGSPVVVARRAGVTKGTYQIGLAVNDSYEVTAAMKLWAAPAKWRRKKAFSPMKCSRPAWRWRAAVPNTCL